MPLDTERQTKGIFSIETTCDETNTGSKSDLWHGSSCKGLFYLFLFSISQVTVMTAYIVLLSTLSMTLIHLVMTRVCQYHVRARSFANLYISITLFNPYNNSERLNHYPQGNWSSGRLKSLFKILQSLGSKAGIQIHLVWPEAWATFKTQIGFNCHG